MPPSSSALATGNGAASDAILKGSNCNSTAPRCGCRFRSACARPMRCATCSSKWPRRRGARRDRGHHHRRQNETGRNSMGRMLIAAVLALAALPARAAEDDIVLRGMGSFHVGGRIAEVSGRPAREIVRIPGGPPSKLDPNGEFMVEQMYVQYFLPKHRKGKLPLLMWHGGGLTGVTYETTPDGREGWLNLFVRKGWDVYVSDAVERGRAGFASPDVWPSEPIFLNYADPFERFRIGGGEGRRRPQGGGAEEHAHADAVRRLCRPVSALGDLQENRSRICRRDARRRRNGRRGQPARHRHQGKFAYADAGQEQCRDRRCHPGMDGRERLGRVTAFDPRKSSDFEQRREGAMRRLGIVLAVSLAAGSAWAQGKEPIALRDMGSFHVGGRVIEITGVTYETTPDGRAGWLSYFIRKGWDTYISDAVERGRAGWTDTFKGDALSLPLGDPWERFRIGPPGSWNDDKAKRTTYPGAQFPIEAYAQFMKQGVPRWLTTDDQIVAAYIELVDKVCPCVVMVHSQSGTFGYRVLEARPDKVKALVAVEPTLGGDRNKVESIKTTPILVVDGDNAKDHPRWSKIRQGGVDYAAVLRSAGGSIDVVDLPDVGIKGNSHMMMMDKNNAEIADLIQKWLLDKGLAQ